MSDASPGRESAAEMALRHVHQGRACIRRQHAVIERLESRGLPTKEAFAVLEWLHEMQARFEDDHQKLLKAFRDRRETSGYRDPTCGGVLSQIRRAPPLRFRCQVGHAYSAEILESEQQGSVDEALCVALRIVEERTVLTQKMAEEARREGRTSSAALFEQTANSSRRHAGVLRKAISDAEQNPESGEAE